MRNEEIITALVEKAENTTDPNKKKIMLFILSNMKEQRTTIVPGRDCLNASESEDLFTQLVEPVLDNMNTK